MKRVTKGVSPKLIAAVVTGVVTYLLGQTVLELSPVVTVIGQAILIAVAAAAAPPGNVVAVEATSRDSRGRFTAIAPVGLLAAAHPDLGLLFVLLVVLFLFGAAYLVFVRRPAEWLAALACVVIAILIVVFLV